MTPPRSATGASPPGGHRPRPGRAGSAAAAGFFGRALRHPSFLTGALLTLLLVALVVVVNFVVDVLYAMVDPRLKASDA